MNIFHQNLSVSLWANLSHSNNETGRDDQPSTPSIRALAVWYAVLMTVSLAGAANNLLLFVVICRSKTLRGGAGFLIAHIVLIYVVLCLLLLPLSYTAILIRGHGPAWQLSPYFCRCGHDHLKLAGSPLAVKPPRGDLYPSPLPSLSQRRNTLAILAGLWVFAVTTTGLSGIFEIGGRYITSLAGRAVCLRRHHGPCTAAVEIDVPRLVSEVARSSTVGYRNAATLGLAKMLLVSFLLSFLTGLPNDHHESYPQLLQRFVFYAMNKDFPQGAVGVVRQPAFNGHGVRGRWRRMEKTFGRTWKMKTISHED
ncbi:hypothetical protein BV898_13011 [Hypsibius exemplaris]|uniref:G-protein coupled receptors family 1 profile domain-containing protein n=1 Tax=Hypsibius exemplaris TaxID=2072580 RepID=A0A1W0WBY4_HYPEX|nr:hypothetical protein BV898_13011 [Hypsibius exemplaris]